MKAVVIEKPNTLYLTEKPMPEPPAGFARIKVKAAAFCATDLEVIGGNIPAAYPLTPGHEWSGIVDAVGSAEDSDWIGKRVIGSNDIVCLKCDACRSGNWRYCREFREIGFKADGAYAEYVLAPVYGLAEMNDTLSFEEAALCEPLGVALGTMKKTGAALGDTALIMGAGSIGLCMLSVCKAMGLRRITVCATTDKRLSLAKQLGAYETIATRTEDLAEKASRICPDGYDVVIDATGIEECITNCIRLTKKGGVLALAGYGRGKTMGIRIDDIHVNNLRVVGAGNNWNMHKLALALMEEGIVNLKPLISNRITIEEFEKGIDLMRNRPTGFVKAEMIFE